MLLVSWKSLCSLYVDRLRLLHVYTCVCAHTHTHTHTHSTNKHSPLCLTVLYYLYWTSWREWLTGRPRPHGLLMGCEGALFWQHTWLKHLPAKSWKGRVPHAGLVVWGPCVPPPLSSTPLPSESSSLFSAEIRVRLFLLYFVRVQLSIRSLT